MSLYINRRSIVKAENVILGKLVRLSSGEFALQVVDKNPRTVQERGSKFVKIRLADLISAAERRDPCLIPCADE